LPILEIGCGGGQFLHALRRRGHTNLTGIDRPPELAQAFEGTGIRYRAQDLDLSLDLGGPFAAIVMHYAIEHFTSPEAVLSACRRALSPGGRVLLLTPNAGAMSHSFFGQYWSGLHAPRHTQIFSPESLQRLAKKVGFAGAELVYGTDLGSWTLSFQNFVESRAPEGRPPRAGTAWYSLALLPAWYPFALVERVAGRSGAMFAILTV
jgi:2-polyprenyl-3-methyl-5-hydroxy-6-metoxy-1,4-benzoquinol methylase